MLRLTFNLDRNNKRITTLSTKYQYWHSWEKGKSIQGWAEFGTTIDEKDSVQEIAS